MGTIRAWRREATTSRGSLGERPLPAAEIPARRVVDPIHGRPPGTAPAPAADPPPGLPPARGEEKARRLPPARGEEEEGDAR